MGDRISNNELQHLNKLNQKLNETEIKLGSHSGENLKFNIFDKNEKVTITEDTKDFLLKFDSNKDGTIDFKELVEMKGHLIEIAGEDKVLTEQELGSPKLMEQLKTLVQRFTANEDAPVNETGENNEVTDQPQANKNPEKTTTEYTVARGEGLWKIAKNLLGEDADGDEIASMVQEIIKLNPQIKNPSRIFVGDKINIPVMD